MIDDEFSVGDADWHCVRLLTREAYDRGTRWLLPRVPSFQYSIIWRDNCWDVYLRDPDLAFEMKLRFG